MQDLVSVTYRTAQDKTEAQLMAARLGLPFETQAEIELCLIEGAWGLKKPDCHPIFVEFDVRKWRKQGILRTEHLIRACQPAPYKHIIDLTAGLGRDAALLASFGASLTLIERDPIMAVLLRDGIRRGIAHGFLQADQITLIESDAQTYLSSLSSNLPDVIYYDPMHPSRRKSAKVKKALQCLSVWLEPDNDILPTLTIARERVRDRVVMKWPAGLLPVLKPNYSFEGKTIRFDVFLKI